MKRHRQVAGFILAGGASSRMGRDKALLDFGGAPLLLRTARLLEPLVATVTVVGTPSRYSALGLRGIADGRAEADAHTVEHTGANSSADTSRHGPLAGISAALLATRSRWNLIVACDMPYLSAQWLDWLLSRAERSRAEAVVPQTARGLEPLAAVYRRECAKPIAAELHRGERKVTEVIAQLRLELVSPRDWRDIDSADFVLKNMNAPRDYKAALKWWSARTSSSKRMLEVGHVTKSRPSPKRRATRARKRQSVVRRNT